MRTLSSSYRIHTNNTISAEAAEDPLSTSWSSSQPPQASPPSSAQLLTTGESSSALVYVLCVPVSNEVELEWRGENHYIPDNKNLTPIVPINTDWKTTSIFLLTQQTNHLEKFDESFKERLSKINVQQSDLYDFETKTGQIIQKRSCFEKVDRAMNDLAHSILSLSNCIASNVEQFEKKIEELETRAYVVSINRQGPRRVLSDQFVTYFRKSLV